MSTQHVVTDMDWDGTMALGPEGIWAFTSGHTVFESVNLPEGLSEQLNEDAEIHFIAMSAQHNGDCSKEIWFVRHENGTAWGTDLPQALRSTLHAEDVNSVFLGPGSYPYYHQSSEIGYLVIMTDGSTICKGLPGDMESCVDSARDEYDGVRTAAMGPDGEWFVLALDGTYWSNALHPALEQVLSDENTGTIQRVRLGPNGTFVCHLSDRLVWRMHSGAAKGLDWVVAEGRAAYRAKHAKRCRQAVGELNTLVQHAHVDKAQAKAVRRAIMQLSK